MDNRNFSTIPDNLPKPTRRLTKEQLKIAKKVTNRLLNVDTVFFMTFVMVFLFTGADPYPVPIGIELCHGISFLAKLHFMIVGIKILSWVEDDSEKSHKNILRWSRWVVNVRGALLLLDAVIIMDGVARVVARDTMGPYLVSVHTFYVVFAIVALRIEYYTIGMMELQEVIIVVPKAPEERVGVMELAVIKVYD